MKWNIRILFKVLCLSLLQWAYSLQIFFESPGFSFYSTSFMKPDDFRTTFLKDTTCTKQNIKNQAALMAWALGRMMRRRPTAPVKVASPAADAVEHAVVERARTRPSSNGARFRGVPRFTNWSCSVAWWPGDSSGWEETNSKVVAMPPVTFLLVGIFPVVMWEFYFRFFLGSARWKSWTHNKGTV